MLARGFVLTMLLLVVATELLVRSQVLPQDTRAGHLALLDRANQVDAAFGDSHAARGFAAQDTFVNLAYPSENIEDMFAKVRTHYANRSPGRVVLQADPHLFAAYRVFAASSQPRTDASPLLHAITDRHRPQLNAYWQAFFEGYGTLASTVQQTENGALLSEGNFDALPQRMQTFEARTRLQQHASAEPDAVAAAQDRYAEMLDFLITRGAQVCLVSFPVTHAYRAAAALSSDNGHMSATTFFRQKAKETGARYVDARAQVTANNQFRDVDHLNAAGATAIYDDLIAQCFEG